MNATTMTTIPQIRRTHKILGALLDCAHCETTSGPHFGFSHCVNPHDCRPAAHGNICYDETCAHCGATRRVNQNRGIEATPWTRQISYQDLDAALLEVAPKTGKVKVWGGGNAKFEVRRSGGFASIWIQHPEFTATYLDQTILDIPEKKPSELAEMLEAGTLPSLPATITITEI
jgi:hypothetical protein